MGQFLAIGLVVESSTSKKELEKYDISKDDLIVALQEKLHFEPSIYEITETADSYNFKLKESVIENQLLHFLEKFYPIIYSSKNKNFEKTLEMLKSAEPSTWLQLSEDKSSEEFQLDNYGENDYLYFDKPFKPRAIIYSTSIMLAIEGKISMESYGTQFNFFKYCIQQTFNEFSLAKAIRVYITG